MGFSVELNRAAFKAKITTWAQCASENSKFLIDHQLNRVEKSGFHWWVLCLMRPFCAIIGRDVYSHVRVNAAARGILEYCQINKKFFLEKPHLLIRVEKVLTELDRRTSGKYQQTLKEVKEELKKLGLPDPKPSILITPFDKATTVEDPTWKWPSDLNLLQVTPAQKKLIDLTISTFIKTINTSPVDFTYEPLAKDVHLLTIIAQNNTFIHKISLPIRLRFVIEKNDLSTVLLCCKKVIGSGGERKVRLSIDLMFQKYYVRKRVSNSGERSIVDFLLNHTYRGIVPLSHPQELASKKRGKKVQYLEPLCNGTLTHLLGTHVLANLKQKLLFMEDLLSGLRKFHGYSSTNISIVLTSGDKIDVPKLEWFHFDIKCDNILVRRRSDGKRWEALISDFGLASKSTVIGGTVGCRAPEEVQLCMNKDVPVREIIDHNVRYGQPMDMWSMGLICIIILTGRVSKKHSSAPIPPLPCIEDSIEPKSDPQDAKVALLTQEQIDQDLVELQKNHASSMEKDNFTLKRLWSLVGEMLKIDPDQRTTASKALERVKDLQ